MKLKGISPLEQNVDRIVLGVVSLALVGAVGLQFLPETQVKIGTSPKTIRPTQAMSIVEDEARTLSGKLDSSGLPVPQVPAFSLNDKLALGRAAPANKGPRVALGRLPEIAGTANVMPVSNESFGLPAVPAPTGGVTNLVQVTISPIEKLKNADLAKLLPEAQPFDKTCVSVEFGWNGAQFRDALQSDPDGEGPASAMPLNWWRDQAGGRNSDLVEIVAVQYERETITKPDGNPPASPESVVLAAPPGRPSKLAEWRETVRSAGDVAQVMLPAVQEASEQIQRPKFYDIVAGPEWVPPSKAENLGDQTGKIVQINRLKRQLEPLDKQIADLEKKLQELGPAGGDQKKDQAAPPAPAPRPGKGGSQGGPPPDSRNQPKEPPKGDRHAIEATLKRRKAERDAIIKQLTDLGEVMPGTEGLTQPGAADGTAATPTLENPNVRVWTHDLTAQPGATYRYRARVVVNNPLFGRNLQEAQGDLARQQLVEGPWSEWTEPVHVARDSYYFITSASEPDAQISPQPTAAAEMYVFKYGYYRRARVQLTPGDSLWGEAKMPETLKYADMEKLKALVGDPAAATGANPPPPAPDTGKGPRSAPGTATPQAPGQPEGMDAIWTIDVPDREAMVVDVTFLDATPLPTTVRNELGNEQVRMQAVLRDELGRVVVRRPDLDASNEVFKRVSESAKAGETQGAVIVKNPEPDPARPAPQPDRPPTRGPTPPPGGPGGG